MDKNGQYTSFKDIVESNISDVYDAYKQGFILGITVSVLFILPLLLIVLVP